jgi:hypothetical protein
MVRGSVATFYEVPLEVWVEFQQRVYGKPIRLSGPDMPQSTTPEYEQMQRELDSYESLDQAQVVLARREQAFLRRYLFRDQEVGTCAICGEILPAILLVAAHIKPRATCGDAERRDYANNVMPMCLLGCDALFERGLVVIKDGKVQVRMRSSSNNRLDSFLKHLDGRPTLAWKKSRVKYFRWHAQNAGRDSSSTV